MTVLLIVAVAAALWLLLPLPAAVAVGRAFRAGEEDASPGEIVVRRDYDAVGM